MIEVIYDAIMLYYFCSNYVHSHYIPIALKRAYLHSRGEIVA